MKNFGSVLAAYLVVWGVLFVYVITIAVRTNRLQRDIESLKESLAGRSRG